MIRRLIIVLPIIISLFVLGYSHSSKPWPAAATGTCGEEAGGIGDSWEPGLGLCLQDCTYPQNQLLLGDDSSNYDNWWEWAAYSDGNPCSTGAFMGDECCFLCGDGQINNNEECDPGSAIGPYIYNPSLDNTCACNDDCTCIRSIHDIQYNTVKGDNCYDSNFTDQIVTTTGIITAIKPGIYPTFYIQDFDYDSYAGIFVYDSDQDPALGDKVTITAEVTEYYGLTELINVTAYNVTSNTNSFTPKDISTGELANGCTETGESLEGMLVRVNNVIVTQSTNIYNEWYVNDGSGECIIDDYMFDGTWPKPQVNTQLTSITGVVNYSYYNYKISPRLINDFIAEDNVFGCTDPDATNYDPDATIDNGSCVECNSDGGCIVSIESIINGEYEVGEQVIAKGIVSNYWMPGPSVLTINDESQNELDIVWWDDFFQHDAQCIMLDSDYNIPCSEIFDPPHSLYYVYVTGTVYYWESGAKFELILNDQTDLQLVDIYSCTDPSACNNNDAATIDDGSCLYVDDCGECGGNNAPCLLPFGTDSTLDVLTWNIEFFPKQYFTIGKVHEIINTLEVDIIALQEIASHNKFSQLKDSLNNSNSTRYWDAYTPAADGYLELAYLIDTSTVEIMGSPYTILDDSSYYFANRPPYVIEVSFSGTNLVIINNHFKCCGNGIIENDTDDEEYRRLQASILLKEYVDNNFADKNVIILGDLNDEIGESPSNNVFQDFIDDSLNYYFADMEIALGNLEYWSLPGFPGHIDHILITNELFDEFNNGISKVQTLLLDDNFSETEGYDILISNHLPVGLQLLFGGGCTSPEACNYDENITYNDGSCTYPEENYDCDGNCIATDENLDENGLDCSQVCGGGDISCLAIKELIIPEDYNISSIYPNPFNPVTSITYGLPENTDIQVTVYDIGGTQIATLVSTFQTAGYHTLSWNASSYPSGVYLIRMVSGNFAQTQKVVLVK